MSSTHTEDNENASGDANENNAIESNANQENAYVSEQSTSNGESTSTSSHPEGSTEKAVNRPNTRPADDVFRRRIRKNSGRNYRPRNSEDDDATNDVPETSSADVLEENALALLGGLDDLAGTLMESSSSSSDLSLHSIDDHEGLRDVAIDEDTPTPKVLLKQKPKHKWFVVKEVVDRQKGSGGRFQSSQLFQQRCYGSLHVVQRLELMYKLEEHTGCVNNIKFNQSGTLLASASDDKQIALWDWACGKCLLSYESGHTSNVFQAKFLPLSGDCHIVSCARDGQVRLAVLSNTGVCKNTRLLARHTSPTHKLSTHPTTPHVFLSAGEDAIVMSHDVRSNKSSKILIVKDGSQKVGLYSIDTNPINNNEFCVTGEDCFIRLYDRRKLSSTVPLKKLCPQNLVNSDEFLHVTCAVYNYNGTEILGSFNDDDIYLFDTRLPDNADYVHKYEGHRNSVTVKAVNFFGPRSEFIVSGSDCGNIFFWDKHTESIVQWMRGDEDGVVNCLETHPQIPIIATSGLDSDIKIWVPSCEQEPAMVGLKQTILSNHKNREEFQGRRSDPFDGQMRFLWRQILRFERNRGMAVRAERASTATERTRGNHNSTQDSAGDSSSTSEDEANPCTNQCTQS